MKHTKLIAAFILAAFILAPLSQAVARDHSDRKMHAYAGQSHHQCGQCGHDRKADHSLKDKFFKIARFYIANQDEIGLSDKQVQQIIDLKIATKKDLISKKAEIKIAKLDVKVALKQKPIDLEAVKKLISTKYDLKKQKALNLAEAYVKLKSVLSDEQSAKAKEIWHNMKEEKKLKQGRADCPRQQ
jgi:hypothetical protein